MRITGPTDPRLAMLQRLALGALPRVVAASTEPVAAAAPVAAHAQSTQAQVQAQASVAMLVAIAASDPETRRRRNIRAADTGLKALEALHGELRIGAPTPSRLRAIAAWMDDHHQPDDPAAAELLQQVELRVLVELAKAERDG